MDLGFWRSVIHSLFSISKLKGPITLTKSTDVVITNYGGNSTAHLHDLIYRRCVAFLWKANIRSLSDATVTILQFVLQECMKHEPSLHVTETKRVRPLDGAGPFSSEIASEVSSITPRGRSST